MPVVDHDLLFVSCLSAGPFYHNLVAGKTPLFFTVEVAFATYFAGSYRLFNYELCYRAMLFIARSDIMAVFN